LDHLDARILLERKAELNISVVIPTYNRCSLVVRAIRSALQNIEPGDEILVADDGSTDDTPQLMTQFGDSVRYLRLPHRGAGATRNAGIRAASNSLVAFLDSDDEWMPRKLSMQRCFMQSCPDVLFSATNFCVRKPGAETPSYARRWLRHGFGFEQMFGPAIRYSSISGIMPLPYDFNVHIGNCYSAVLTTTCILTSSLIVRREAAGDSLRFAEDIPTFEDWECFGRLARAGRFAFLDSDTVWNYGHQAGRLTDANDFTAATARLTLVRRIWGSDPAFLRQHEQAYLEVVRTQQLTRARHFLAQGSTQDARAELKTVHRGAPVSYRLAAHLPGWMLRSLSAIRATKENHN
jgi:glycosyltransferase involved in cell wall biosynthesis